MNMNGITSPTEEDLSEEYTTQSHDQQRVQLAEQQEDIYLYFEEQQIIWSTEEEVQDDPNDMDDQEDLWWQLNLDCVDEKEEEAMEDVEMLDEFAGLNISSQEDAMEK